MIGNNIPLERKTISLNFAMEMLKLLEFRQGKGLPIHVSVYAPTLKAEGNVSSS
jgi:hypothetical protein